MLDLHDIAATNPDVVERLTREIERWRRRAESEALPADAEITDRMGPEPLERLRGLGYIR